LAGPLDNSQINGNFASSDPSSIVPPGFNTVQAFDLYTPFIETLFPFQFPAPHSELHSQFPESFL
jgi:hypothetical protein